MDLLLLPQKQQEYSQEIEECDSITQNHKKDILMLQSKITNLIRKREAAKESFEGIKKAKRDHPELLLKRILPEILCDMFMFLKRDEIQKCQEVCYWWEKVVSSKTFRGIFLIINF